MGFFFSFKITLIIKLITIDNFQRFLYYDKLLIGWFKLFETLIFSYRVVYYLITSVKTNHL